MAQNDEIQDYNVSVYHSHAGSPTHCLGPLHLVWKNKDPWVRNTHSVLDSIISWETMSFCGFQKLKKKKKTIKKAELNF